MSDACCEEAAQSASAPAARHRGVLCAVLAINLGLFGVEIVAGLRAGSSALLGDSIDMLGDALVYAASLYVVGSGALAQARMDEGADFLSRVSEIIDALDAEKKQQGPAGVRRRDAIRLFRSTGGNDANAILRATNARPANPARHRRHIAEGARGDLEDARASQASRSRVRLESDLHRSER